MVFVGSHHLPGFFVMPQTANPVIEDIATSSLQVKRRIVTTSETITVGTLFLCDATGGAIALTLPAAGDLDEARILIVKKTDGSGNPVDVVRAGSDLIDGGTSFRLDVQYAAITLADDESGNWHII